MTSDDKSLGAGWERRSPLPPPPLDTEETRPPRSVDSRSVEASGSGGLVFVTSQRESQISETASRRQEGVTLSTPRLEEEWKRVEGVMGAREGSVREVMEEFGVADVPPASDPLEEQLWQVVEGGLTLQEAADLV